MTLSGKTILISGARGFLGGHAMVHALQQGARVAGVDLHGPSTRAARVLASLGGIELPVQAADLSKAEAWLAVLGQVRPDIILHLAGVTQRGCAADAWHCNLQGNLLGAAALIEALAMVPRQDAPVVVYPGSQMEYGAATMPWTEETICQPTGAYGASKLTATELFLAAGRAKIARICVARLALVYGPGQAPTMFVPELICAAFHGSPFRMAQGHKRRRFIYAGDAASLLVTLGSRLADGQHLPPLLNAPASPPVTMQGVAEQVIQYWGEPVDLQVGALADRPGEGIDAWPDDALAERFGLACPVSLEDGLQRTVAWYRDNPWFFGERAI